MLKVPAMEVVTLKIPVVGLGYNFKSITAFSFTVSFVPLAAAIFIARIAKHPVDIM
jgi:hypothetical protein